MKFLVEVEFAGGKTPEEYEAAAEHLVKKSNDVAKFYGGGITMLGDVKSTNYRLVKPKVTTEKVVGGLCIAAAALTVVWFVLF